MIMIIGGKGKFGKGKEMDMSEDEEMTPMSEDEPMADDANEAKREAVKALFRAGKMNDVDAGVEALEALIEACGSY